MDTFSEEARSSDRLLSLLGSSETAGPNFPGTSKRISFAEADKIRTNILEKGIHEDFTAFLLRGLTRIANSSLRDAELSRFFAATGACQELARKRWREEDYPETAPSATTFLLADVALKISSAVACLEGNIPPNHLGYMFDQTSSLIRKDELAVDWLNESLAVFEERPDIVGIEDPGLLFNAIADRVDAHRPALRGRSVRPNVPTPKMG